MDPTARQVAQIKRKCAKKTSRCLQQAGKVPGCRPGRGCQGGGRGVHSFAKRLVTAAMSCGACDPAKSKFEAPLHLSLLSSDKETPSSPTCTKKHRHRRRSRARAS